MKKFLLFFTVLTVALSGCQKIEESIDDLDDRLNALEQTLPTLESQIEMINLATIQLEEVDTVLGNEIETLKSSDKATENEIAALKQADKNLDSKISDLKNYVNNEIQKAKNEAAATYATLDQLNSAKAELNDLKSVVSNLEVSLIAKIDNAISVLDAKIADLEVRLKAVENKVENLLARIQSVSYIPTYSDGKATVKYVGTKESSIVTLDFEISPKDAVAELAKVWQDAITLKAIYTETRTVSFVDIPTVSFEADAENGVITVVASGKNLSEEFFIGTQEASVALVISDGNNSVTSEYVPMITKEITNEIWYTTIDNQPLTPSHEGVDIFGVNIVSNTYENGHGVIKFDAPVTKVGVYAFGADTKDAGNNLQTIHLPSSVTEIGGRAFKYSMLTEISLSDNVKYLGFGAFAYCNVLEKANLGNGIEDWDENIFLSCDKLKTVNIPKNVDTIPDSTFNGCSSLEEIELHDNIKSIGGWAFHQCFQFKTITIPESVTMVGEAAFSNCQRLEYIYGKFASADNRCLVVDGKLKHMSSCVKGSYTLPDNVTTITKNSISYLQNVITLTIPESVVDCEERPIVGSENIAAFYGKFATADNRALVKDGVLLATAFYGLTEYVVPEGVTKVCEYAFRTMNSSTAPSSTKLTKIVLPSTLKTIKYSAFEACRLLKEVYCKAMTPPALGADAFAAIKKTPTIYVPTASVDAYKAAVGWKNYDSYIVGYDF